MLIQVSVNNIESVEQGEEILKKWHYRLDEDQSHVLIERDINGLLVRVAGFHPWADEFGDDDDDDECCCDDDCDCSDNDCHHDGEHECGCGCHHDGDDEEKPEEEPGEEGAENEGEEEAEEVETIYLGQALFVPAEQQAHALAVELMDDDYIGTVTVRRDGTELTETDAFRALPVETKDAVIAALEELGDTEAYLSLYEVMGYKD